MHCTTVYLFLVKYQINLARIYLDFLTNCHDARRYPDTTHVRFEHAPYMRNFTVLKFLAHVSKHYSRQLFRL